MNELDLKKSYSDSNYMYMARIELTTKCNFRCKHCFIEDYSKNSLSKDEIFRILDNLRKHGVYIVEFTGGEIFTRPDIMEILRYARKLKFHVSVLSNLSLLTDEIINELDTIAIEGISTTLFSMEDTVNDAITGVSNSASRIIENLKKLARTRITIEVKTVLMNINAGEHLMIQKFCRENGFEYLATEGIFPAYSGDEKPRELAMSTHQLIGCIRSLDEIRFGKIYKEVKSVDEPLCCELHYSLFVGADGECYPCNLWFRKLGNIKEYNYDISKVWLHPFLEYARKLTWHDAKKCLDCENNQYCIRCTGIVESVKGDALLEDPFACRTSAVRRKIVDGNNF